uniref:Integrase catalytic domain-containing protein n=1 Tax=Globodera rostochiensis TaxID=31243 RepID=A0A914IEH9_GLORO
MDSSNEKEAGDGHQGSISIGNRTTLPSPKVELIKAALDPLYNDLSSPSAFAGVEGLQREARKKLDRNKLNISKKDVQNYLEGHRTYTLLRPRRVRFPRAKTVAAGFMTDVQVDLADLQTLSRHNRGYRYLLVAVDVLSKRLFVVPLLTKRAEDILQAFKQLIEQMPMAPHRIFSDKGTEFRNRLLKEFFEQQDIAKHEPVHSSVKASVAERAIRNVKQRLYRYFAQKETLNWVDVVQKIIDGINNSVSRVHGMRPVDVNFKNAQQVWLRIYGTDDDGGDKQQQQRRRRPRFRKDEFVRMSREKGQFEKGYLPNYDDEILTIDAVLEGVRPVRYKLRDERGEKFKGTFYEHELARVRKDAETSYRIEKVYRKRKRPDGSTEMLVKFAGYPEREWIQESQLV